MEKCEDCEQYFYELCKSCGKCTRFPCCGCYKEEEDYESDTEEIEEETEGGSE